MRQFTRPLMFNSVTGQRVKRWAQIAFVAAGIVMTAMIVFPVFASAKLANTIGVNIQNLKALAEGCEMYASENADAFPDAGRWRDAIDPFVNKPCRNPFRDDGDYGYGMNADLSGVKQDSVANPSGTILIYESAGKGRNCSAKGTRIPEEALVHAYRDGCAVAFADAHPEFLNAPRLADAANHPDRFKR